jgi:crotonobetainyl-CoA:carnitine CoA-transferase CaiB-like acyl-CoA transferase
MTESLQPGPLAGIRVLDMSRVLAGPLTGQILGDLGAEVVKVERPGEGDQMRRLAPPFIRDAQGRPTTEGSYFQSMNRNKLSVTIDIALPEGQRLVRALAADSDVLIENYRVGQLGKYGLGYADLRQVNPGLIYCSVTGFGQTGPYARRPGYDVVAQAMGGLMSLTGEPEGRPMRAGQPVVDIMTGMWAAIGVLAALRHRDATGEGQQVDAALLDSAVAALTNNGLHYLATGELPPRAGNGQPNVAPYQDFATADGRIMVCCVNEGEFARFCGVIERPELTGDPRYARAAGRAANRAPLLALIEPILATRPSAHWLDRLQAAEVPSGPINDMAQVFADAQVQARGMTINLPHPTAGETRLIGSPLKLSATPVSYRLAPPLLGQHTETVLRQRLGYGAAEIARLKAVKAI